ncbi:uncharacterized protein LOC112340861 [Selaginella moellendorffii]|uniref:uncharacterized protein LOC112340861 n=1 Tax=Selaginella moellendorffii TaxID=88036 RepID=UPI000D1CA1DA|nr:uncharacterized protein LOC112340861 [Selaginella moellendorffii]|eukprot:XP_024515774.1 uncharacterized protein LOC112340861 [Selaginella moellendorffii]
MCILCVASRWSRRIVTMLPWLIFPLVLVWTLSQLLPPGLRFEITSPRLACVGVLLLSLAWYEFFMPRLSEWRTRRSLVLHEKRKIEAQEAAKWRKEAVRKCRNCFMAYKDQKPQLGGKFMCTFCGHLSKRPALDVPAGGMPVNRYIGSGRKELRMQGRRSWSQDVWPGVWMSASDKCVIGAQTSGLLIVFRLVSFVGYCLWWALSRLWSGGIMSDADSSRTDRKAGHRKGDDGSGQESKVDRVRRKAEEKRLARLEKEQMEAEERMQREEVARLVDERRRQRADAQKDNKMADEVGSSDEQAQRRKQEKAGGDRGKDSWKSRSGAVALEDPRKARDKNKRDKRPDAARPVVVVEPGLAKTETIKAVKSSVAVAKPVVVCPVTKQQLMKVKASVLKKQDKHVVSATAIAGTTSSSKANANEGVARKPSAWNRISWAWGKGSGTRMTKHHQSISEVQGLDASTSTSPDVDGVPPSPSPSPALVEADLQALHDSASLASPRACKNETAGLSPVDDCPPPPSPSQSVYSTFMASVPDAQPAYDRWVASDLAPKSTWKMWEAPNLDLPRLTQCINGVGPVSSQPSGDLASSFLTSGPVGIVPSVPITNNLWSNYHAFESARRIWEDDLQSEVTPPEFVDCITQEVMKDPVIAADGHSYERSAIEAWLKTHDTSPKTGEVLPSLGSSGGGVDKSLRPNHNLRGQIIEYKECMQRGLVPAASGAAGWQQPAATEAVRKGHVGGLYTPPPGLGSVWAYSSTTNIS